MRTETPTYIASECILCLHPDGTETTIEAKIGAPYQVDAHTWACPAALEGVDGRFPDIVGEGSLQALSLAMRVVATRLGQLLKDKAQLVYPADRSPWNAASLAALFGKSNSAG